jgi:hypothetical protein
MVIPNVAILGLCMPRVCPIDGIDPSTLGLEVAQDVVHHPQADHAGKQISGCAQH